MKKKEAGDYRENLMQLSKSLKGIEWKQNFLNP